MKAVFIGGTGRSGTTILKRVLEDNANVVCLPDELRVLVDPGGALDLVSALSDRWSPYNADMAIHRFKKLLRECGRSSSRVGVYLEKVERGLCRAFGMAPRRYLGAGLAHYFGKSFYFQRLDRLIQDLCCHTTLGSWIGSPSSQIRSKIFETSPARRQDVEKIVAGFFEDLYGNMAKGGQTHWLDDTPINLLYAHELWQLFPGMRLIHVYRDPRDVVASYQGFSWGGDDSVAIARRVAGIYHHWFEIRKRLPTDCFLEIKLEALAADPARKLTGVCDFVGLNLEEGLLGTSLDISEVHAGRWRDDIPVHEWAEVQSHLAPFIRAYAYPTEQN